VCSEVALSNRRGRREGGGRVDTHLYSIRMDISDLFHSGLAAPFANSAKLESVFPAIHRWENVLLKAGLVHSLSDYRLLRSAATEACRDARRAAAGSRRPPRNPGRLALVPPQYRRSA
jgi:hypothetical protein